MLERQQPMSQQPASSQPARKGLLESKVGKILEPVIFYCF